MRGRDSAGLSTCCIGGWDPRPARLSVEYRQQSPLRVTGRGRRGGCCSRPGSWTLHPAGSPVPHKGLGLGESVLLWGLAPNSAAPQGRSCRRAWGQHVPGWQPTGPVRGREAPGLLWRHRLAGWHLVLGELPLPWGDRLRPPGLCLSSSAMSLWGHPIALFPVDTGGLRKDQGLPSRAFCCPQAWTHASLGP